MYIALVSLNQIWENKAANLALCKKYIQDALQNDVSVIIFPEMTLTGFSMNTQLIAEDTKDSFTIKNFQELARHYKIAIVFGVVIKENEKCSNRLYFIDDKGEILEHYTKIHPFSFANEDKSYVAGNEIKSVMYQGMRFGLTICYDLRFANLYTVLTKSGSDCIINIANWPAKRVEHWRTLLKARAIETQQFVIGVNRTGSDGNGLSYEQSSLCFNANGEELPSKYEKNDMKIVLCEKSFTQKFREAFNTVQDIKILQERSDVTS